MDDYLDSFLTLVSNTRYTDPWTLVVIKFRQGLKSNIQSQITTMPFGRPADTDPEAWYAPAWRINQVRLTNEAFQSMLQLMAAAPTRSALPWPTPFLTFHLFQSIPPPVLLRPIPPPVPLRPTPPVPNTYGCRHSPESMLPTSMRVLSVRRGQPPHKGLPLPLGHLKADHEAMGRIDRRFNGFEGCSRGRGSRLCSREGFCLVRPAKSVPQLLLVNRFTVLNVEKEVNTDIREPIDAFLPFTLDRKALPWRSK